MRVNKQLGLLPLTLPGIGRASQEDDRVLDLFRNRAELKKAYSGAQTELQQWKDRLKQQEGAMARVQESLQALELRLSSPDTAYPALVFYQLRELWACGHSLIEQFVNELRGQREAFEREAFSREQGVALQQRGVELENSLALVQAAAAEAGNALSDLRLQLTRCQAWWQHFERRALQRRLEYADLAARLAESDLNAALAERDSLAAAAQPQFPGLSVGARRAINVAAIAYGHVLYERLTGSRIQELICEAARLREPPDDYGDRTDCERLIAEIQQRRAQLRQQDSLQDDMHRANRQLKPLMSYLTDDEGVPEAGTLAGSVTEPGSRVLQDNVWNLQRLMLR
jgi:hypothetical protein